MEGGLEKLITSIEQSSGGKETEYYWYIQYYYLIMLYVSQINRSTMPLLSINYCWQSRSHLFFHVCVCWNIKRITNHENHLTKFSCEEIIDNLIFIILFLKWVPFAVKKDVMKKLCLDLVSSSMAHTQIRIAL